MMDKPKYNQELRMLTKLTDAEMSKAIHWFADQPIEIQMAVLRKITPDRIKSETREIRRLASQILAIRHVQKALTRDARKNLDHDLEPLSETAALRVAQLRTKKPRKGKPKAQAILLRAKTIEKLRAEPHNCSWREVAEYLKRHGGLEADHTYIKRIIENRY